jgi:hypothetical protein
MLSLSLMRNFNRYSRELLMTRFSMLRMSATALLALALVGTAPSAWADSGSIHIRIVKASFVVGVAGGSGTLTFKGRSYPLSIGGVSFGASWGASDANLVGRVSNIQRASDVAGTYGAAGVGAAVIRGGKAIMLRNEKGAVLELRGRQVGLEFSADLSGLVLGLR